MSTPRPRPAKIRAQRVAGRAKRITDPVVKADSSNHQIQESTLRRNAVCIVERALRYARSTREENVFREVDEKISGNKIIARARDVRIHKGRTDDPELGRVMNATFRVNVFCFVDEAIRRN